MKAKMKKLSILNEEGEQAIYEVREGHYNSLIIVRSWVVRNLGREVGLNEFSVKECDVFNYTYIKHVDSDVWGVIH